LGCGEQAPRRRSGDGTLHALYTGVLDQTDSSPTIVEDGNEWVVRVKCFRAKSRPSVQEYRCMSPEVAEAFLKVLLSTKPAPPPRSQGSNKKESSGRRSWW